MAVNFITLIRVARRRNRIRYKRNARGHVRLDAFTRDACK